MKMAQLRTLAPCLLTLIWPLWAVESAVAQPAPSESLTADRMWSLVRLGDTDISPDGRLAVVTVTRFDVKENKGSTDLWLFSTDGRMSRRLTSDKATVASPRFSPDGSLIAFCLQAR